MTVSTAIPAGTLLHEPGSVTARLRSACEHLSVELLWQGLARLSEDEQSWLSRTGSAAGGPQDAFVREVCLRGDGEPWLLARTVVPTTSPDFVAALQTLGGSPLGDLLFGASAGERQRLEVLPAGIHPPSAMGRPRTRWGRRSLFVSRSGEQLLVSEWLLTACPLDRGLV